MPDAITRRPSALQYEGMRAMLSLAGVRQVTQAELSIATGAEGTYTVTGPGTRRVIAVHNAAAYGNIRFNFAATATATHLPVLASTYFVVDAEKDDVLHFHNSSGGTVVISLMEIE